jgi:nucleotide-binding universal stress UspA family protein
MFRRILVPLDGSQMAEAVLPVAAYLADKCSSLVIPFHVIEKNAPEKIHGEQHLTSAEQALTYLCGVTSQFFTPNTAVEPHVHTFETDKVSVSITDHILELNPDLIIMCNHGRGGVRDLLFGSIAQQVTGMGKIPVLLIQPGGSDWVTQLVINKIMAPIDGNPEHEFGLPLAAALTKQLSAQLLLAMVVPTLGTLKGEHAATGRFLPGSMRRLLDIAENEAEIYLLSKAAQLQTGKNEVLTSVVRGDPASAITLAAKEFGADLLVLSTHGKSGQEAFWASSIAAKVTGMTNIPLLLVPIRSK